MPIAAGTKLDAKYEVMRTLGGGAFGQVYLAKEEFVDRQVAIKLLHNTDAKARADLIHEMKSLDTLHHPNIVAFYHHFVDEEKLFLVMEYCSRGSLRDQMQQKTVPLKTVMQYGKDLADTLYFVHQRGIVHHDIKPDNILFTSEGGIKLGDFGVANRNLGTLAYIPPEMSLGEVDPKDVRVDVYALGITLLELVCHRNPFFGLSWLEALRVKLRHDFIPQNLPRWTQDLIVRATHPTPELRFQSMLDFREAIESQHVSYVFDRSRVQAHALAVKAEKLLVKKRPTAASRIINQALFVCPDCVSAHTAAGRYNLFINNLPEARKCFDQALSLNPRINIQKELGWLALEAGNYSQAISLLTDHLQRNSADYEAFNLLLECFYRTERYEIGSQIGTLMGEEHAPSECFQNNVFICELFQHPEALEEFQEATKKQNVRNPFLMYNLQVFANEAPDRQKALVLFENYRFGLSQVRSNVVTIKRQGKALVLNDPIITIGRLADNCISLSDSNVSRHHCVVVNFLGDVWVYDLNSTQGVFIDNNRIERKAYLEGVHVLRVGSTELTVCSSRDVLV